MKNERRNMCGGVIFLLGFVLWTIMIQVFDVKPEGIDGTDIGFSTINVWFHNLTGVHMKIYAITDWLGLVFFNDKRDLLRCDSLSSVDDKRRVTFLCYWESRYEGA